ARVRRRFESLLSAGVAIFSEHSLERVLQQIVDSAREVVGARYAALGVLAPDRATLSQFVTSGLTQAERERIGDLPRGRGLLGLVIREPQPIRSADINRHPQRYGFPPHHPPMRSFLGVPIRSRGEVFGNLYLTEKTGAKEFDGEDEAITVLLAAHAAVAAENARLHDESQRLVGKVRPVWRDVDIAAAVERAIAGLEPAAEAKRVRLLTEYANGAATLRTDPVRLEQILVNLLSNAVRHSPEGETVVVRVEPGGSDV